MISKLLGTNKRAFWMVYFLGSLYGLIHALQNYLNPMNFISIIIVMGLVILILSLFLGFISMGIEWILEMVGILKPQNTSSQNPGLLDDSMIIKVENPTEKVADIWRHTFVWAFLGVILELFEFVF